MDLLQLLAALLLAYVLIGAITTALDMGSLHDMAHQTWKEEAPPGTPLPRGAYVTVVVLFVMTWPVLVAARFLDWYDRS